MKIFFTLLFLSLSACQSPQLDSAYLMTHPQILKQEIAYCRDQQKSSSAQPYCETVMYAAANLMSLSDEAESHPQEFGERILKAQEKAAQMANALSKARQQTSKEKIVIAEKAYQTQQEEVAILLAVVGMEEVAR